MELKNSKAVLENDRRLSVLHGIKQLFIKQKPEVQEVFSGVEESNVYMISTKEEAILKAVEVDHTESSRCMVFMDRPFAIDIVDADLKVLLKARSADTCFARTVTIECPSGQVFAVIEKPFSWFKPTFFVKDDQGTLMFRIDSPLAAAFGTFDSAIFPIYAHDEKTKLGYISKDWSGLAKELFTDTDIFVMDVPADMDAAWKAVLLSVLFLIDFTFYEQFS